MDSGQSARHGLLYWASRESELFPRCASSWSFTTSFSLHLPHYYCLECFSLAPLPPSPSLFISYHTDFLPFVTHPAGSLHQLQLAVMGYDTPNNHGGGYSQFSTPSNRGRGSGSARGRGGQSFNSSGASRGGRGNFQGHNRNFTQYEQSHMFPPPDDYSRNDPQGGGSRPPHGQYMHNPVTPHNSFNPSFNPSFNEPFSHSFNDSYNDRSGNFSGQGSNQFGNRYDGKSPV